MMRMEGCGRTRRYFSFTVSWRGIGRGEVGKRREHSYVLIDTGQLSGWPDGRERPRVLVLSFFFFFIVVAQNSTRTPHPWFLTAVVSSIADS